MRRAILLYNPNAGKRSLIRRETLSRIMLSLAQRDIEAIAIETVAPGSAGQQALDAVNSGFDTVFACGGDGTVHEVVQGFVSCPTAVLGIIPFGSANVLAKHLMLSWIPTLPPCSKWNDYLKPFP